MIPIQSYIHETQPEAYKTLAARYPLPELPRWVGKVEIVGAGDKASKEAGPVFIKWQDDSQARDSLTPFQRWIDKFMRRKPKYGKGE